MPYSHAMTHRICDTYTNESFKYPNIYSVQVNMSSEITSSLLTQAKEQLGSGDFENAAKTARGLLALDDQNVEAKEILIASEGAVGNISTDDTVDTEKESAALIVVADKVQVALNNKKMPQAEKLIKDFVAEYPNNQNAQQILSQVQTAHSNHKKAMDLAEVKNAQMRANLSSSGYGGSEDGTRRGMISTKSFAGTLVLCFLFGWLGVHRFYVGKNSSGIIMFLTVGGFGLWALIDLLVIAFGNFEDGQGATIKP
jgi:hypothetical protein